MRKNRKIVSDFAINVASTGLVTIVLNLIIYPQLAFRYGAEDYGTLLAIIGLVNVFTSSFGNSLNNVRLLLNKEYDVENHSGNYMPLISIISVFSSMMMPLICVLMFPVSTLVVILIALVTGVGTFRAYLIVSYRLLLDYRKQLYSNCFLAFGYLIGLLVFQQNLWPAIFLLGELCSLIYVLLSAPIVKEPYKLNQFIKLILTTYGAIIALSILGNCISYIDRLLVYPLLGATAVTIFSVASFMGKATAAVIEPIANVLLSYFNQKNFRITAKLYTTLAIIDIIGIISMWGASSIISEYILGLLYPLIIDDAREYINIACIAVLCGCACNLIRPANLTICKRQSVVLIEIIYSMVYVCLVVLFAKMFGLCGFCYAMLISNMIKLTLHLFIGYRYLLRTKPIVGVG